VRVGHDQAVCVPDETGALALWQQLVRLGTQISRGKVDDLNYRRVDLAVDRAQDIRLRVRPWLDIDHDRGGVRIDLGLSGSYDAGIRQCIGLNRLGALTRQRNSIRKAGYAHTGDYHTKAEKH